MSYAIDRPAEPVNPAHYRLGKVELIELIEQLSFNAGNAVKYLVRAGRKSESPVEDLRKAAWYLTRELFRITGEAPTSEVDRGKARIAELELLLENGVKQSSELAERLREEQCRRAAYQEIHGYAVRFVRGCSWAPKNGRAEITAPDDDVWEGLRMAVRKEP